MLSLAALLIALVPSTNQCSAEEFAGQATFRVTSGGKSVLGRPIEFNAHQFIMVRRDGRMVQYRTADVKVKQVSNYFTPYTPQKLQEHYRKLFGDRYEVTRTRHYVVVHPRGMRKQWADPFDELYNRFTYYFSVRNFTVRRAEFPMVVVVFNSKAEFNRVANKDGLGNPNSYAGYYSPTSNWIVTYRGASPNGDDQWEKNETLIHEALHQFAFNHGIHQRYAPTPKWCAEGLASMFEVRGVNNSRQYRSDRDRWNPAYIQMLQNIVEEDGFNGVLKSLVASDRLFQENIALSYATSWGLAFYLAETHPAEFNAFLQRTAQRSRLENYSSSDRIADFARSFGTDFTLLESHFARYIKNLK